MTKKDYCLAIKTIQSSSYSEFEKYLIAEFCCKLFSNSTEKDKWKILRSYMEFEGFDKETIDWHLDHG